MTNSGNTAFLLTQNLDPFPEMLLIFALCAALTSAVFTDLVGSLPVSQHRRTANPSRMLDIHFPLLVRRGSEGTSTVSSSGNSPRSSLRTGSPFRNTPRAIHDSAKGPDIGNVFLTHMAHKENELRTQGYQSIDKAVRQMNKSELPRKVANKALGVANSHPLDSAESQLATQEAKLFRARMNRGKIMAGFHIHQAQKYHMEADEIADVQRIAKAAGWRSSHRLQPPRPEQLEEGPPKRPKMGTWPDAPKSDRHFLLKWPAPSDGL